MRLRVPVICIASMVLLSACGSGESDGRTARAGYAVGRVTFEDGSPITGDVQDYSIALSGVTEAGERVSYSPIVKDGRYSQKLAPGQYRFGPGKITVKFGEREFRLDLVPVGPNAAKNQDAAAGIVQDFVWKPTGQRDTHGAAPSPNNHTHWHGLSVGMRFTTWREDTKAAPVVLPEGTTLVFTLTPTSKSIDGRDLQPITIERAWRPAATTPNDDLNDLPPANYEMTGIARLPDGSTRPILFQGKGVYPNYTEKGLVTVEYDSIIGGMWKQLFGWVTN